MPDDEHGPSIKDPDQYDALREEGASKEKAARISNASNNQGRDTVGERGGHSSDYQDRTKDELIDRAHELDIHVTTHMKKEEIIDALRNH